MIKFNGPVNELLKILKIVQMKCFNLPKLLSRQCIYKILCRFILGCTLLGFVTIKKFVLRAHSYSTHTQVLKTSKLSERNRYTPADFCANNTTVNSCVRKKKSK